MSKKFDFDIPEGAVIRYWVPPKPIFVSKEKAREIVDKMMNPGSCSCSWGNGTRRWPEPTEAEPSSEEIGSWFFDDVVPATDGCEVEPDGVCPHGHPSWMVKLGII